MSFELRDHCSARRRANFLGFRRIVVLAADISPLDILTHLPLLAEEANCPYIVRFSPPSAFTSPTLTCLSPVPKWVTSKEALGLASSTKRPTSCVMIAKVGLKKKVKEGETEKEGVKEAEEEFQTSYKEVEAEVAELVSVPDASDWSGFALMTLPCEQEEKIPIY